MAQQVWTRRLYGPGNLTATTGVQLFVVPAGHVYVVRNVMLANNSTTAGVTARVSIGPSAGPTFRCVNVQVGPDATAFVETRLPLIAGEQMWGILSVAGSTAFTVSGYDFLV